MNELIIQAKASYENIRNVLREIANVIKEKNSLFSEQILLEQFSLMMQAIMLRQIAADGVVTREERLFIREICDRYDLLDVCKHQPSFSFKTITWEQLETFTTKTMALLSTEISDIIDPLEDEMTFYIALVDANTPIQYYKIFFQEMSIIFSCLNYIDNNISDAEKNETISAFLDHFIKRYKFFYQSFKEQISNG